MEKSGDCARDKVEARDPPEGARSAVRGSVTASACVRWLAAGSWTRKERLML